MRHRRLLAIILLAAGLTTMAALAPARAGGGNLAARVDGTFTDAAGDGTFDGTLTFSGFERRGDRLVAIGSLDGAFTDATGKDRGELDGKPVVLVVDRPSLAASCEQAKLTVTAGDVEASGVVARLQPVELEIGAGAVPGNRLGAPLCELAKTLDSGADLGAVATGLDRLLAALE